MAGNHDFVSGARPGVARCGKAGLGLARRGQAGLPMGD